MSEPERDPRVYFAAERTLLAWLRTGLALMGFGFVVARFGWFLREIGAGQYRTHSSGYSAWAGTVLVIAGVVVNAAATIQYVRIVRDLKEGREFAGEASASGIALSVLLALVGVGMAVYLITLR